jgi:hypothetical protein
VTSGPAVRNTAGLLSIPHFNDKAVRIQPSMGAAKPKL